MSTEHRPHIICHMMTSLDGKIASGIGRNIFDEEYLPLYDQVDEQHDTQGWMCGRVTMEMFAEAVGTSLPSAEVDSKDDFISSDLMSRFAIAVDTQGLLRWSTNSIKFSSGSQREFSLVILVTAETPVEYLAYLQSKNISYLMTGKQALDWSTAMAKLSDQLGIKKLLVEGGGKINGSLLKNGYIDELSLLMIPFAVNNSQAPSLFQNEVTPAEFRTYGFSLKAVQQLERDVVWLRYLATKVD